MIREQVPLADGSVTANRVSLRSRGGDRCVGDRAQVQRRWPQAGRRLLARRHDRRDPRVHRRRGLGPAGRTRGLTMTGPSGMFLVDKPAGPSSFGVLRALRPALGSKTGHAGTLDPFATGLLLVVAGRATRLARFLSGMDKRYRAVIQFGARSSTLDPEGDDRAHRRNRRRRCRGAPPPRRWWATCCSRCRRPPRSRSTAAVVCPHAPRRDRRGAAPRTVRIDRLEVTGFDADAPARRDRRDLLERHLRAPDRRRHRRGDRRRRATASRCAALGRPVERRRRRHARADHRRPLGRGFERRSRRSPTCPTTS